MDEKNTRTPAWSKQKLIVCGLVVLGTIVLIGIITLSSHHVSKPSNSTLPSSVTSAATIPLYFPRKMNDDLHLVDNSASLSASNVVSFDLANAAGSHLIITEQTKPPLMEEVTKTKEFSSPIGHAYLANLNGRSAGFIVGEKTLIILSVVGDIDDTQLVQLMQNMAPAN